MDQPDGDRAFTDRRRHAFDRATPYVTDSEDAPPAGPSMLLSRSRKIR